MAPALWMTSSRWPWSSRSPPERESFSDPAIRGAPGPVAATAYSVSPMTVKIVAPSVLTASGSSTPSSCTFVVEWLGAADSCLADASGAAVAFGACPWRPGSASGATPPPAAPCVWAKWPRA